MTQADANSTSLSLLERLRQPDQAEAWSRFVDLYTPLLYSWGRRVGLQPAAAADLVQDVLLVLVQKLPEFQYDRTKSFRSWLKTVTLNHWRASQRRRTAAGVQSLDASPIEAAAPDEPAAFEEEEYRQEVVARAMQLMQAEFESTTWQAFWRYVAAGQAAEQVAAELGLTVNAVYLAKSRVLRRLRRELQGLLE